MDSGTECHISLCYLIWFVKDLKGRNVHRAERFSSLLSCLEVEICEGGLWFSPNILVCCGRDAVGSCSAALLQDSEQKSLCVTKPLWSVAEEA